MEAEGAIPGAGPGARSAPPRLGELNLLLLGFYLEMRRGMEEFRRVYGLSTSETPGTVLRPEMLAERLFKPHEWSEALRELEMGIQELKIHHAALLEGYQQATQDGARELLQSVDPERLRETFEGGSVQVGPLRLSSGWKPLLLQAIWEEMLRKFQEYRTLEPGDFERFFVDGFRRGYRRFWQEQLPGTGIAPPSGP
jgi:hypothetical protein